MGEKLCPKIILEGTRLTFKTEIAFALNEHPRIVGPRKYRYHSPLISAEWCAFTNFPWGRGLINFDPAEEEQAMETYRTWVRLFELQRYYSWIVDRFHISTQAYQLQRHGKYYDFRWLEDRLEPLGFRLVFCTRSPDSFRAARAERLKVSGKPAQYDDLEVFIREQEMMQGLIESSKLPRFTLDVSDNDVSGAVERIADWMEHTGGLYMREDNEPADDSGPLFTNVYDDAQRAQSYAALEFPGTYFLAYRDLPHIIAEHVSGRDALDFGCGTGRSTRFLKNLGFYTVGVDIAEEMVRRARERDPEGDYRQIDGSDLRTLGTGSVDLVLSAFTFDNIPTADQKLTLLCNLRALLNTGGRIVNLVSSPDIYTHEWASFTTRDFPENSAARNGDRVRIVMTDVEDRRPVEDILCTDEAYRDLYAKAGLAVIAAHRPLGKHDEPCRWVNEMSIAPWVIYVLKKL